MNVAIFTDNDFGKVNGVTTTLAAALEYAPDDLNLRVYTCDDAGAETGDYLSLAAFGDGNSVLPRDEGVLASAATVPAARGSGRRRGRAHDDARARRTGGHVGRLATEDSDRRQFPHRSR